MSTRAAVSIEDRRHRRGGGLAELTIGLDVGTTSVKGLLVDADGRIRAKVRVPHSIRIPEPDLFEHDAVEAWCEGPARALAELGCEDAIGIGIAGMVPSCAAVDGSGRPLSVGLLYGDRRGRSGHLPAGPLPIGEAQGFLEWLSNACPDAQGYWPAQAVAATAIGGEPVVDLSVGGSLYPLFDGRSWDESLLASLGVRPEQLPRVATTPGEPAGRVGDAALAAGSTDGSAEQLVAGADEVGDALVICGTTLITWVVTSEWEQVPGLWSMPATAPGRFLLGGASNAGGLFLSWAQKLLAVSDDLLDPGRVPLWVPYVRGERTPLHDASRRASLEGLDLTHTPGAVRRAAYEAAGFVVRHHLDLSGAKPSRIVVTGGGAHDDGWMQALADTTGLPVQTVAVPEGAALGMAWLARMAAGRESTVSDARRWVRPGRHFEPESRWLQACAERYARFRELSGRVTSPQA